MIEIVVSACFVTEPTNCRDVRLSFVADSVTPQQCMFLGQSEIAKWSEGNPNWKIMKWSCGQRREIAKI